MNALSGEKSDGPQGQFVRRGRSRSERSAVSDVVAKQVRDAALRAQAAKESIGRRNNEAIDLAASDRAFSRVVGRRPADNRRVGSEPTSHRAPAKADATTEQTASPLSVRAVLDQQRLPGWIADAASRHAGVRRAETENIWQRMETSAAHRVRPTDQSGESPSSRVRQPWFEPRSSGANSPAGGFPAARERQDVVANRFPGGAAEHERIPSSALRSNPSAPFSFEQSTAADPAEEFGADQIASTGRAVVAEVRRLADAMAGQLRDIRAEIRRGAQRIQGAQR